MARNVIFDYLQSYAFWLMDVPSASLLEWPVFNPLFGFNAISMPEITLETQPISEANWFFPRTVIKSASVGAITLSRGATPIDSDFYQWVMAGLSGNAIYELGGVSPRRDFVLVQFFSRNPLGTVGVDIPATGLAIGPLEFALRIPAKAWMLKHCMPTRYKPGTDFSAQDSSVSMAELEMSVEHFEEIGLTSTFNMHRGPGTWPY